MPDDRARISRFGDGARTDISMGERMLRFVEALQTRICREIESADGLARFAVSELPDGEGRLMRFEDGARFASAGVEASSRRRGEALVTGIRVDLRRADGSDSGFGAYLHHVAMGEPLRPDDHWFEGSVWLDPAGAGADRFSAVWRWLCA